MSGPGTIWVCFAVKQEARPFRASKPPTHVRVLITGMGQARARQAIQNALRDGRPALVLTCGFAGGLKPGLQTGTVLVSAQAELQQVFVTAGAVAGSIHCAEKVAVTPAKKAILRFTTRSDAVDMESGAIAAVCEAGNIPCATVRVILDTASEDLPLDFNQLMTAEQQLGYGRLALAIAKSPGKIRDLIALGRRSGEAARALSEVLNKALPVLARRAATLQDVGTATAPESSS
jgi:adenosylhomocysteine nucleosidase